MDNAERNWGAEPERAPTPHPGDQVIFSEHGRIINKTDYRSHWFMLVQPEYGPYTLLVKHGGGEERIPLDYKILMFPIDLLIAWSADARYLLFSTLLHLARDQGRQATAAANAHWSKAFLDGRLKKRRRNGTVRVEIEPAILRKEAS